MVGAVLVHAAYLTSAVPFVAKASVPQAQTSLAVAAAPASRLGFVAAEPPAALPPAVLGMREAILEAVQSGRIEDLKVAFDLNELKPELAAEVVTDPVAFWRKLSDDGEGRGVLKVLGALLDLPHAVQPFGKDPENTALYVWPVFADRPLQSLTPEEEAQLSKLEAAAKIAEMRISGRYTGWRLVIGADGVWHSFRRYD